MTYELALLEREEMGEESNHTLQILMYYLMGLHSIDSSEFQKVKWLALFNPRKNIVYYINIGRILEVVIDEFSKKL